MTGEGGGGYSGCKGVRELGLGDGEKQHRECDGTPVASSMQYSSLNLQEFFFSTWSKQKQRANDLPETQRLLRFEGTGEEQKGLTVDKDG